MAEGRHVKLKDDRERRQEDPGLHLLLSYPSKATSLNQKTEQTTLVEGNEAQIHETIKTTRVQAKRVLLFKVRSLAAPPWLGLVNMVPRWCWTRTGGKVERLNRHDLSSDKQNLTTDSTTYTVVQRLSATCSISISTLSLQNTTLLKKSEDFEIIRCLCRLMISLTWCLLFFGPTMCGPLWKWHCSFLGCSKH